MNKTYISLLQQRLGSTAVGASTARSMGPKGTIQAARQFLQVLDMRQFDVKTQSAFIIQLNAATIQLRNALPKGAKNWGSARKFLNIFLRNCAYNKYFCAHYKLERIESWLEVPLDSHVVKHLKKEGKRGELPRWKTVIGLTVQDSSIYQQFATIVAAQEGVLRVHLDVKYWRQAG